MRELKLNALESIIEIFIFREDVTGEVRLFFKSQL